MPPKNAEEFRASPQHRAEAAKGPLNEGAAALQCVGPACRPWRPRAFRGEDPSRRIEAAQWGAVSATERSDAQLPFERALPIFASIATALLFFFD